MTDTRYAEQEIIGGLIRCDHDQQADIWAACHGLTPLDFYHEDSRQIYASIAGLMQDSGVCDLTTLEARLSAMGKLQDVGGFAHLATITSQSYATNPASMAARVAILKEVSAKRQLLELAHQIEAEIQDGRTVDDVAGMVSGELGRLVGKAKGADKGQLLIHIREAIANIKPMDWLIRGYLPAGSLIFLHAAPKVGKTFVAVDWAVSIAAGVDWQGAPTQQGAVLYISGEGNANISKRFLGNALHRNIPIDNINLYLAQRPVTLPTSKDELISAGLSALEDSGFDKVSLVVLDTYRRTLEGDENSNQDAGAYIAAADALRERLGCSVLVVHHSNRTEGGRMTGASSLLASADTVFWLYGGEDISEQRCLHCQAMKDAGAAERVHLLFEPVELPGVLLNPDIPLLGNESTLVPVVADAAPPTQKQEDWRKKIRGSNQKTAMTILETMASASDTGWVKLDAWTEEAMQQVGIQKASRFHNEVSTKLEEKGFIRTDSGHVCLLVGKFAREELREELGRIGQKREELESPAVRDRAELGREFYRTLPISSRSAQKPNSAHDAEYEEVMGL